jgi:DNA-binding beta-propeller fold protein YncE
VCLVSGAAGAQDLPRATELPGKPFVVKKTWMIGGEGDWDYLTLDPEALRLYVAHGTSVQVVDVNAGTLAGQVTGLRDAHGIALDDTGAVGFISDGGANRVRIFDRNSLQITASAPTGPNPRAIVYEPLTKLVFAICSQPVTDAALARLAENVDEPQAGTRRGSGSSQGAGQGAGQATNQNAARQHGGSQSAATEPVSVVSVIDSSTSKTLGHLLLTGHLGYAVADEHGEVYISVLDRNRIAHFNAQTALSALQQRAAVNQDESVPVLDWSGARHRDGTAAEVHIDSLRLSGDCRSPRSLAIDGEHLRIFVACENQKLQVLNTGTGDVVTTLTIGPGTDAIGYDAERGLIYTANGGGLGSLTVIRRDVADTYNVIQEVPTKQRARTLAVNSTNGEVYLVTNLEGFDLSKPGVGGGAHTLPVVQASPAPGSFQVLVVGN